MGDKPKHPHPPHPVDPIECKPFRGVLSARACVLNRRAAMRAYDMLDSGVSVFMIDEIDLDRLMGCSRCRLWPPDRPNTNKLLWEATRELAEKVANFDEYGPDPELMRARARERGRRWREKHREEVKLAKRLAHLRQQHKKLTGGN